MCLAAGSVALVLAQDAGPNRAGGPGGGDVFRGPGGPGGPRQDMEVTAQFDKDKNGFLDKGERPAAREFVKKERAAGRGGRGGFGGPGGPGGGGFGPGMMFAPGIIAEADKNADQKVSKEEFGGLADAWF